MAGATPGAGGTEQAMQLPFPPTQFASQATGSSRAEVKPALPGEGEPSAEQCGRNCHPGQTIPAAAPPLAPAQGQGPERPTCAHTMMRSGLVRSQSRKTLTAGSRPSATSTCSFSRTLCSFRQERPLDSLPSDSELSSEAGVGTGHQAKRPRAHGDSSAVRGEHARPDPTAELSGGR